MFKFLKSLFKMPEPAGPPEKIKGFTPSDKTINQDSIKSENDVWIIETKEKNTIRLFEIPNPNLEKCFITYRAKLKTENVQGKAYLEMWCRLPGGREFFSKGFQNAVKGTNEWGTYEIPFYLKEGQKPDLIKLNITIEGTGKIWIKEIELLKTPLK